MILNPKNFLVDIPKMNPLSYEYRNFWKEEKRKCIEGIWVGGRYMPGNLYFYINYCHILLNKKTDPPSAPKKIAKPFLRDLEWEFAYGFMEARGFTNFEKLHPDIEYEQDIKGIWRPVKGVKHLLDNVDRDLGKPLYLNQAKNLFIGGARGSGKSFAVINMFGLHEFLFDGLKEYTEETIKNPPTAEILIGAGETKYSTDTLMKLTLSLDNLPGAVMAFNKYYPSPFSKKTTGSLQAGTKNVFRHEYQKKEGNSWVKKGTKSKIYHRSFKNDAYAANGTRTTVAIFEEAGLFGNLKEVFKSSVDTQMSDINKFGTMVMLGTGGDMQDGTVDFSEMFTNPSRYDAVAYKDIWEDRYSEISYFIPYHKALNLYKDDTGFTILEKAKEYTEKERAKKKEKSSSLYESHIQNNPDTVSEMFLSKTANIFPIKELQDHLIWLEKRKELRGTPGSLKLDHNNTVVFEPNPKLKPLENYPLKDEDERNGCVVIYEQPTVNIDGTIPFGLYVGGLDPVDQDESPDSPSLMSTFIYKTFQTFDRTYNIIVAEYTGRPERTDEAYEITRRLLLYYNAQCLYENMLTGFKAYMQQKRSLHLLKVQPGILKKMVPNSKVKREYGIHMTKEIKKQMELYIRDWLLEERGVDDDGKVTLNLHKIYSIPLLQELILYDRERNTDRVIAFGLVIIAKEDNYLVSVEKERKTMKNSDFWKKKLFKNKY